MISDELWERYCSGDPDVVAAMTIDIDSIISKPAMIALEARSAPDRDSLVDPSTTRTIEAHLEDIQAFRDHLQNRPQQVQDQLKAAAKAYRSAQGTGPGPAAEMRSEIGNALAEVNMLHGGICEVLAPGRPLDEAAMLQSRSEQILGSMRARGDDLLGVTAVLITALDDIITEVDELDLASLDRYAAAMRGQATVVTERVARLPRQPGSAFPSA